MKDKIIIGLGIALAIVLFFLFQKPKVVVETQTTYDTIIETRLDTIDNTKPTEIKEVIVKVPITKYDTIEKVVYKDVKTNRYTYLDTLSNGIVNSTIFADKIYERSISLKTFDKTIVKNVKETIVMNTWYVGGTVNLNQNKNVLNQSLNVFYTHKGKWMIGGGLGYSNDSKEIYFPLTFAVKF